MASRVCAKGHTWGTWWDALRRWSISSMWHRLCEYAPRVAPRNRVFSARSHAHPSNYIGPYIKSESASTDLLAHAVRIDMHATGWASGR
jgi:hypothetical protein